ncbi:MAG TPA: ABC transporter ATP-binding protein [Ignavibacteriaceae bacterium]|nr:ABC transporter ATP-binding protein [Ignavibacteriaceae bacterium]
MKSVSLKNIRKKFYTIRRGTVEALKGINLEIEAGEFFVLLGPSGCGKSTLLNIIAGIERPTEGEIHFEEQIVVSAERKVFLSPRERDVAMVFQSYALYPHMSVRENISFPLKIAKMDKAEISRKVEKAAGILEINEILEAKPGELSGGQRQRVALGRAIVREPNVLLLDEPLSNLDAMLRITMRSELKEIQRELNLTTIYVTHDQTEAMSLGDQIAVLREGEVQQTGTPYEIYNEPENLFVARFIGTPPMNILDMDTINKSRRKIERIEKNKNLNLIAGLRPEDVNVVPEDEGLLKGNLKMIGPIGSESLLYLSVNGKEIMAKIHERTSFNEGDSIGISFDENKLLLFDKEKEKRIEE